MKVRVNILSGPNDWLRSLRLAPVPVFHTGVGREVGTARDFEIDGEDMWAVLHLVDGTPGAERAAGVVLLGLAPGLIAVLFSNLSRAALAQLAVEFGKQHQKLN